MSRGAVRAIGLALILVYLSAWKEQAWALDTGAKPDFTLEDLKAPSSPAFVLLGVEPTSVERPDTPRAFVADLLSTLQESEGIPKDYALAMAPYWLTDHPDLTFDEYFEGGPWKTFLQTLSVSLASHRPEDDQEEPSADDVSEDIEHPAVGLGFRGMLIGGQAPKSLTDARTKLEKAQEALLNCTIEAEATPSTCETEGEAVRAAAKEVEATKIQRVGFTLDIAGGGAWAFPEDRFDERQTQRWGFWVTPAYRFADDSGESNVDALGVLRYIREKQDDEDVFDVGARVIWHVNDELALSAEYVRRETESSVETETDSTERLVGLIEYRLTDKLFLVGSYGEDFATDEASGALVSTLGLKIGLGKEPRIANK